MSVSPVCPQTPSPCTDEPLVKLYRALAAWSTFSCINSLYWYNPEFFQAQEAFTASAINFAVAWSNRAHPITDVVLILATEHILWPAPRLQGQRIRLRKCRHCPARLFLRANRLEIPCP